MFLKSRKQDEQLVLRSIFKDLGALNLYESSSDTSLLYYPVVVAIGTQLSLDAHYYYSELEVSGCDNVESCRSHSVDGIVMR